MASVTQTDVTEPYRYAVILLFGMLFVTPIGGISLSKFGVPLNPALLAVLGLSVAVYGTLAIWYDNYDRSLLVAVLVLMTFGSFIPLAKFLPVTQPPGLPLGPKVYLVDPPLLLLSTIVLSRIQRKQLTQPHGLLALSAIWALLLVVVAPNPRLNVTVWYAVHILRLALVFLVVSYGVTAEWVEPRTVLGVVVLTVVGHSLAATVQLATGPIEQLNVLGINTRVVATLSLGPLGTISTGPYIGGLTGGAAFANHLVLILPVVAVLLFVDRIPHVVALVGAAWMFVLLQLTAWDAARGAMLVGGCLTALLVGWWVIDVLWSRGRLLGDAVGGSRAYRYRRPLCVAGVVVAAVAQLVQFRGSHPSDPTYLSPTLGQATAAEVVIPGFSTANLTIRLHQYVGGLDTFLKYPLTGLGGGNFQFVSRSYGTVPPNMIHNLYIGVIAETGVVGAVLYFGVIVYGVRSVYRTARIRDDPVFLGLVGGVGGFLALQMFQPQYLFPASMMLFWAVLGIGVGDRCRHGGSPADAWTAAWDRSTISPSLRASVVVSSPDATLSRLHVALVESRVVRRVRPLFNRALTGWRNSRLAVRLRTAGAHSLVEAAISFVVSRLAPVAQDSRLTRFLFG